MRNAECATAQHIFAWHSGALPRALTRKVVRVVLHIQDWTMTVSATVFSLEYSPLLKHSPLCATHTRSATKAAMFAFSGWPH